MLLTGTFARAVDDKLRIAIPKRIRDAIGEHAKVLYVAPGTDGSLCLYTEEAFAQLGSRLAENSPIQQDVRAFSRLFYSQAEQVDLDAQGRVRIPVELAKLAGLQREAVLIGVRDHLELWDRPRWEAYMADKTSRYDEIAEAAFGKSTAT